MIAYAVQVLEKSGAVRYSFHELQDPALKLARALIAKEVAPQAVRVYKLSVVLREDLVEVLTACCGHLASHLNAEVVFHWKHAKPKTTKSEDLFQ